MLTVGSLFSGIGGLDLGLERAGMNVIWQSEIDPYGCRVLKKHWPEVVNHGNIKEIKWGDVVRPDIICGGYPCQPFSTAGKRNGTDDPRHLWPWVREAISELRPKYAILENVRGHVSLGLNVVLGEMASIGYDAEWQIVSAASVGAPHRRDRVIIVAYPNGGRQQKCQSETEQTPGASFASKRVFTTDRWLNALMANADHTGSGTPTSETDRDRAQEVQEWGNEPQFGLSGCSTDVADTTQQFSNGKPDNTRNSARPEKVSQSRDSGGTQNVANTNSISGYKQHQWQFQQPHIVGRSQVVADPDSSDTPDGRECEGIPSQDRSWGDDGSRSGSDIGQVSLGSTGKDSSDMADTDARETSRGLRGVSADTGQVRQKRNYARGEESHAGRQWWAVEPDVGRVAHGIPSRVDRLRGLGNAVVPQVAELIGRMVIDYDTNL